MSINKNTSYGTIKISDETIATLAGSAISECYGIVGMTSKNIIKDTYLEILKKDNYAKGITVTDKGNLDIDIYIIVSYGVKISQVVLEAQKRIKYVIEKNLEVTVDSVNIYVQGVKSVE